MTMRVILVLLAALWVFPASAATIQYQTASGVVVGASDSPVADLPGYSRATVSGPAAAIQWPMPSGCGQRDPDWVAMGIYRVTSPATVSADGTGLGVRPGVACFRGSLVQSAADVDAVVHQLIATGWDNLTGGKINDLSVILALVGYVRCLVNPGGANCAELQVQAGQVNSLLGTNATLLTNLTNLNALLSDAAALKAAQGW